MEIDLGLAGARRRPVLLPLHLPIRISLLPRGSRLEQAGIRAFHGRIGELHRRVTTTGGRKGGFKQT